MSYSILYWLSGAGFVLIVLSIGYGVFKAKRREDNDRLVEATEAKLSASFEQRQVRLIELLDLMSHVFASVNGYEKPFNPNWESLVSYKQNGHTFVHGHWRNVQVAHNVTRGIVTIIGKYEGMDQIVVNLEEEISAMVASKLMVLFSQQEKIKKALGYKEETPILKG